MIGRLKKMTETKTKMKSDATKHAAKMAELRREDAVLRVAQTRAWADLIEAGLEYGLVGRWSVTGFYYHPSGLEWTADGSADRADLAQWIRFMVSRGAKITKEWPESGSEWEAVRVEARFPKTEVLGRGGEVLIALISRSKVCERVVIGEREVTEQVPDPELVKDVPMKTVTRVVEDIEWRCSPMLGERAESKEN